MISWRESCNELQFVSKPIRTLWDLVANSVLKGYLWQRANWAPHIAIESVPVAPGGVHESALSPYRTGGRRPGVGHHRPRQRPLAPGKKSQSFQTDRNFSRGSAPRGAIVRVGSRRDARRRPLS